MSTHMAQPATSNPYPGLRPFSTAESSLFFGREEQCDELLSRLATRKLVAVVGSSGGGKSSLVQAGLLPVLDRGYLPEGGTRWHTATFRPGATPLSNLIDALVRRRLPSDAAERCTAAEIEDLLRNSSLGLATAARRLLGPDESLIVVADQFEEIFRFRGLNSSDEADEDAVDCVDLLVEAAREDVPVFIVITMRSDYLGACARFARLPAALNDSQFLVPRMTRQQLRAAIEGPAAVRNGSVAGSLVQRLLHDIEHLGQQAARSQGADGEGPDVQQDELPLLQHTLSRLWTMTADVPGQKKTLTLAMYEDASINTVENALNNHAETVFMSLSAENRAVARLMFQRLTELGRDLRRPTSMTALEALCAGVSSSAKSVQEVVNTFSEPGQSFLWVNAKGEVDISHESLIRRWQTLRGWVEEEARSRRVYSRLVEAGAGNASLYRGPELAEARTWWNRQKPTPAWASRYDTRFEVAETFLNKSKRRRQLVRLFSAVAMVAVVAVAVVLSLLYSQREEAERERIEAEQRTAAADARALAAEAKLDGYDRDINNLKKLVADAQSRGDTEAAARAQATMDQLQRTRLEAVIESQRAEIDRLAGIQRGVDTTALKAEISKLTDRVSELTAENKKANSTIDSLNERNRSLEVRATSMDSELAELKKRPPDGAGASGSGLLQVETAIYNTLQSYAKAVASGQIEDIKQHFPGFTPAQANTLNRQRNSMPGLVVTITPDRQKTLIAPDLSKAVVEASVVDSFQRGSTGATIRNPPRSSQFDLARNGEAWVIVREQN